MNYLDFLLLLPLVYGAYKGFTKGFIIEVATLLGLLLGVFIAIKYSYYKENFLRDFLNISTKYLTYIALGITFLLVAICIYLLGKLLTKIVDIIALGLANKLMGMVLGSMKYFVALCVLLMIVDALNDKFHFLAQETMDKSLLFNPFLNFARKMYNLIRF